MAPYQEKYPVGSKVKIVSREKLNHFLSTWKYHNKLTSEQLRYASNLVEVQAVNFYHGGDVLYQLKNAPGIWHEQCLEAE
jgi:hypothetical protein